jgi:hypothetical protein
MTDYAWLLETSDPERCVWLAKVCMRGGSLRFFGDLIDQMREFAAGRGEASVVFAMGHVLKENLNVERRTIFGKLQCIWQRKVQLYCIFSCNCKNQAIYPSCAIQDYGATRL